MLTTPGLPSLPSLTMMDPGTSWVFLVHHLDHLLSGTRSLLGQAHGLSFRIALAKPMTSHVVQFVCWTIISLLSCGQSIPPGNVISRACALGDVSRPFVLEMVLATPAGKAIPRVLNHLAPSFQRSLLRRFWHCARAAAAVKSPWCSSATAAAGAAGQSCPILAHNLVANIFDLGVPLSST